MKLVTSRAFDSSEEGQDAPPERHQQTLQKKMGRMGRCPHISLTATVAAVALPAPPYHQHPSAATGGQVTVTPIRTTSVRTAGMLIKSNKEKLCYTDVRSGHYNCSKMRCTGKIAPPDENLVNGHS